MRNQPRLSDAVTEYLRLRRVRYAHATVVNEGYVLRRFAACYGDVQVRHMRPERVAAWFYGDARGAGLLGEHRTRDLVHRAPITATTHNYYRSRLKSFFRFCTQRGWLREDLLMDVEPMRVFRRERQQPSPQILLSLLDAAANDRDRAYIALAINTALRSREVTHLKVGSVDLKSGWLTVTIFKSSQEDLLPITRELNAELREWLHQYALDLGRPLHRDDYLFPARRGSVYRWYVAADGTKVKGRTPAAWLPDRPVKHTERIVQEAMRRVGLETKHEGTHTIRRAVARAFFDKMTSEGYDEALRTVSVLLHHRSSATTEHYLGLSSERKRRDALLHGQPFLTTLTTEADVMPLRASQAGTDSPSRPPCR